MKKLILLLCFVSPLTHAFSPLNLLPAVISVVSNAGQQQKKQQAQQEQQQAQEQAMIANQQKQALIASQQQEQQAKELEEQKAIEAATLGNTGFIAVPTTEVVNTPNAYVVKRLPFDEVAPTKKTEYIQSDILKRGRTCVEDYSKKTNSLIHLKGLKEKSPFASDIDELSVINVANAKANYVERTEAIKKYRVEITSENTLPAISTCMLVTPEEAQKIATETFKSWKQFQCDSNRTVGNGNPKEKLILTKEQLKARCDRATETFSAFAKEVLTYKVDTNPASQFTLIENPK